MPASLSTRELEVQSLLLKGCTNREVADILGISDDTAKQHVRSVLAKRNVASRSHLLGDEIEQLQERVSVLRTFAMQCAGYAGVEINGNRLSAQAAQLLAKVEEG